MLFSHASYFWMIGAVFALSLLSVGSFVDGSVSASTKEKEVAFLLAEQELEKEGFFVPQSNAAKTTSGDEVAAASITKEEIHRALMKLLQVHGSKFAAINRSLPDPLSCDVCSIAWEEIWVGIQKGGKAEKTAAEIIDVACHLIIKDPLAADICSDAWAAILMWAHSIRREISYNLTVIACADLFQVCKVPCCESPDLPEQVHLTHTAGDALTTGEMQVTWVSASNVTAPSVEWWPAATSATNRSSAVGQTRTYTTAGWVGWIHGAVMSGLHPDTEYTYKVGSAHGAWSKEYSFKTLPLNVGAPERPLRVATFADMGVGGDHKQTIAELTKLTLDGELDLIVHTGDISYADGDDYRWDRFMREMEPIISRVPYMTCPGNHEGAWNFTAYKQRFFTPLAGYGGPDDAMYYTFSVGKFRFLLLDTETWWDTPRMDPAQVNWADRVLTEANEQKQFIYAGFHRPLYCSTSGASCSVYSDWLRHRIEPLLHRHNVGIVHTGHIHNYERTYPVYKRESTAHHYNMTKSFVSVVDGSGGCTEGISEFGHTFQPEWSAMRIASPSFLFLQMTQPATTYYQVDAVLISSRNGTALDKFTLTKMP